MEEEQSAPMTDSRKRQRHEINQHRFSRSGSHGQDGQGPFDLNTPTVSNRHSGFFDFNDSYSLQSSFPQDPDIPNTASYSSGDISVMNPNDIFHNISWESLFDFSNVNEIEDIL